MGESLIQSRAGKGPDLITLLSDHSKYYIDYVTIVNRTVGGYATASVTAERKAEETEGIFLINILTNSQTNRLIFKVNWTDYSAVLIYSSKPNYNNVYGATKVNDTKIYVQVRSGYPWYDYSDTVLGVYVYPVN